MQEMITSYPFRLHSHPDRLLADHLVGVHELAIQYFDRTRCDFTSFDRSYMQKVIKIAAQFHDFGKATSFFQKYLQNPKREDVTSNDRKRRSHGLISAITTWGILKEVIPDDPVLQIFGFIIVRRHHGNLIDFRNLLMISQDDLDICRVQIDHIDYHELKAIQEPFGFDNYCTKSFMLDIIKDIKSGALRKIKRLNRQFETEHYFVLNLFYSVLLQADKTDAVLHNEHEHEAEILPRSAIIKYKSRFTNNPVNPIHQIRNQAFQESEDTIETLESEQRVLSLNIPTGSGKTITSLNAALKIMERYGHDHIIYCLPFTSVIDQNFSVFADIHAVAEMPDDSGSLLKHHHLTDIHYQTYTDGNAVKEYLPNAALHLIEGWESRLTVTTFVQFMNTLINYKNASLRKFHRLSNAVIILDEIQTIPHSFWSLIREMLLKMAERLDTRIILVTATMPLIFSEEKKEIKELVKGKEKMFKSLSRIELDNKASNDKVFIWDEFLLEAQTIIKDNSQKDILFVMNTIRCARELYEAISAIDIPHEIEYLSSHIIPQERLHRIKAIKNRTGKKPVLVVSTQLVEAGVDIDLDIVVRDFAPLDSIFQASGRCNRENRNGVKGKVLLYKIKDSQGWIPSNIYQGFLCQKTQKVMGNKKIIPEEDFLALARDYFTEVFTFGSQRESNELLNRIEKLEYQNSDKGEIALNLINDDYTSSLFVALDDRAEALWEKYLMIMEMENGFEKNVALKQVRRQLSEYIINIPQRCLPDDHNSGIYYLRKDRIEDHYDFKTGFNHDSQLPPEQSSIIL